MRSEVAEAVREEQRKEVLSMTAEERIALCERISREGLAFFMETHQISRSEAVRRIRRQRQAGRRSSCNDEPFNG